MKYLFKEVQQQASEKVTSDISKVRGKTGEVLNLFNI